MEITREQAKWLLNVYNPIRQYGMVSKYIDLHIEAMSIIKGKPVSKPSCGCEFGAYGRMANDLYEQNEQAIKDTANPPVVEKPKTTRGRKKSNI